MLVSEFIAEMGYKDKTATMCANVLMNHGHIFVKDVLQANPATFFSYKLYGAGCQEILFDCLNKAGLRFGMSKREEISDKMFEMSVEYLKSLGYDVILVKGEEAFKA